MPREVRMVPPNWEHPEYTSGDDAGMFRPVFNATYESAAAAWKEAFYNWEGGVRNRDSADETCQYWDWGGMPPDVEYYLPDDLPEATWFQFYEVVSEGTPISPPFELASEMIAYLIAAKPEGAGISPGLAHSFVSDARSPMRL